MESVPSQGARREKERRLGPIALHGKGARPVALPARNTPAVVQSLDGYAEVPHRLQGHVHISSAFQRGGEAVSCFPPPGAGTPAEVR